MPPKSASASTTPTCRGHRSDPSLMSKSLTAKHGNSGTIAGYCYVQPISRSPATAWCHQACLYHPTAGKVRCKSPSPNAGQPGQPALHPQGAAIRRWATHNRLKHHTELVIDSSCHPCSPRLPGLSRHGRVPDHPGAHLKRPQVRH